DQGGVGGVFVKGLGQGNQHTLGRLAGNGADVAVTHAFRAHEGNVEALFPRLAQDQPQLRVVATEIGEVDAGLTQAGDQRGEVLVASGDAIEDRHLDTGLGQHAAYRGGDAFAVLLLVMDHGDFLRLHVLDNIV